MSNLSEQNVLKFNLFKQFNDKKEMVTNFQNSRHFSKNGVSLELQSLDQFILPQNKSQNECFNENGRKIKININMYNKNNKDNEDILKDQVASSPRRKKSIEINKKASQSAYLKLKLQNQKQYEEKINQQHSQNGETSFRINNNKDICLSYSRTLNSFKDIKSNDFSRTMIKKLLEKKNITYSTRNTDFGFKGSQTKYLNEIKKYQNIVATERSELDQKNRSIVNYNQIEQNTQYKYESAEDKLFNEFKIYRENIENKNYQTLKKIDIKQPISERTHLTIKADNVQIKKIQKHQINENINHNSNEIKTFGNSFQVKNIPEELKYDEKQNQLNLFMMLSSKRRDQKINLRSMRQKQNSFLQLSPDYSSIPLNGCDSNKDLFKINISQNKIFNNKQEQQNFQFYPLPTNQNEKDQLYSQQFQNVIIPVFPEQYLVSPQKKIKTNKITQQQINSSNNSQVRVPSKISAKFRQSFKESIENHTDRQQKQLLEIQNLLFENSAIGISVPSHSNQVVGQFQNIENLIQSNQETTQSQLNKVKQNHQSNKKIFKQSSYEKLLDMPIQQNQNPLPYADELKSTETNIQKQLDANQVFENLPFYHQPNEFNFTDKLDINEKQYNTARFIFSQQNFKKRHQPFQDKKIFKL